MARPRQASFNCMGQPPCWIYTSPFADSIRKVGIYRNVCTSFMNLVDSPSKAALPTEKKKVRAEAQYC